MSTPSLRYMADLIEALGIPRNTSYWQAPDEIPLTDANGEPVGVLVWNSQRQDYTFRVTGVRDE